MKPRNEQTVTAAAEDGAPAPATAGLPAGPAPSDAAQTDAEKAAVTDAETDGETAEQRAVREASEAEAAAADAEAAAAAEAELERLANPIVLAVLDGEEDVPVLTGRALLAHLSRQPQPCLIFGSGGVEVPGIRAEPVQVRDLVPIAGDRLQFTGAFERIGDAALGPARVIDCVALADGPDGPVRGVCTIGPFAWPAGTAFAFGNGAFVF